jgi:hypothetical protein
VRLYINSTGTGCTSLCVLNPTQTIAPYAFNQANQFINAGEVKHTLLLALPRSVTLPNPWPASPRSTILVATTRGNVFSFQWPFRTPIYLASSSAFSSGILRVAYQSLTSSSTCVTTGHSLTGCDSKNEPGPVNAGSGGTVISGRYCHNEPLQDITPADSGYAEKLTVSGVSGGTLYFVNPWITEAILSSAVNLLNPGTRTPQTQLYIYAVVTNTFNYSYTVQGGTLDLTWYSTDHVNGVLYGLYYPVKRGVTGQFYPTGSLLSIAPGATYYAIFIMNQVQLYFPPPNGAIQSVMFWGSASLSTSAKDQSYFSGTILSSGLWIRPSC